MMTLAATHRPWDPVSEHDRLEVKEELERILVSPPFRNSRRYPALLRYVVEKTLSGEIADLKERTLGIEVFHRTADYDTNEDPVVRFSAGEIRRRIAQFYQENGSHSPIEISLPIGTYIPQFSRVKSHKEQASIPHEGVTMPSDEPEAIEHKQLPPDHTATLPQDGSRPSRPFLRISFLSGLLAGALVVAALSLIGVFLLPDVSWRQGRTPIMEVWGPLVNNSDTVLISVGRTHVEDNEPPEPPNATIEQHILRPGARISLAAVQAISQVAGFLQTQRKQFRIREAYSNSLQDFHQLPVVLVSGYNNPWTLRLLRPFRFRFERVGSLHYIVDAQHPERHDWSVDFDTPYARQTEDYAIVARFNDTTTNGPVAVAAGIGSNGSQAAGEFIVSPGALQSLARFAPGGTLNQNFEAVLKVEVVAGNTGAVTVVATQFW
jgi:hypothetical protein